MKFYNPTTNDYSLLVIQRLAINFRRVQVSGTGCFEMSENVGFRVIELGENIISSGRCLTTLSMIDFISFMILILALAS